MVRFRSLVATSVLTRLTRVAAPSIDAVAAVVAVVATAATIAVMALVVAAPLAAASGELLTYQVPRIADPIDIDGVLDEPAWASAASGELPYEIDPAENAAAVVRTVVRFAYDDSNFYIGFEAYDPRPEEIRAYLSDRDKAFRDDFVGVILDTFDDDRNAYQFFVNPLGVQMDGTRDELGGGREDFAWDAIWDAAGRITEEGYVVEMAIPFRALRFQPTAGEQTWGIAPFRAYPRSVRRQLADFRLDRDNACLLCQTNQVVGFAGATPGRSLELTPTVTSGRNDRRDDFPTGELREGDFDTEAGLTVSWGATPNITVAGTVNPDFSQVEADVGQLDINETFALFFEERRPFFVEGADFFRTPIDAVFTRNVADPSWGAKATGKAGDGVFGVFVAQDEVTNLLFPGSQFSRTTRLDTESTDAVVRYRRDLGDSSALGILYTGRDGGDYANHVAGFDGLWRVDDRNQLRFQALGSSTRYPDALAADFDQPTGTFDDQAFVVRYDYDSRNWNGYARVEDRGRDFRADMGFLPRVDYRFYLGGLRHRWIGEEDDWYTGISVGGDYDLTEDQDGNLLEREAEISLDVQGPWQSFAFVNVGQRDRTFNGVTFDQNFGAFGVWARPTGSLGFGIEIAGGDGIDFTHTRAGDVLFVRPELGVNVGRKIRFDLSHAHRRLDVDGGRLFAADLSELRGVYQINLRTFVRAVVQLTTIDRDPALYADSVDAETERLFSQLLFSYKLNPRTVLFLGYTDSRLGDEDISLTQEGRSLFLKIGYAWVI